VEGIALRIKLIKVVVGNSSCFELSSKGVLIKRTFHPLAMDIG